MKFLKAHEIFLSAFPFSQAVMNHEHIPWNVQAEKHGMAKLGSIEESYSAMKLETKMKF